LPRIVGVFFTLGVADKNIQQDENSEGKKKCLTSLEISEIRVSLSSYCSFKMPSNRASASTDLKKKKKKRYKIVITLNDLSILC